MEAFEDRQNRLPPMLKPGDTIGIAAPASPFDRDLFDAGFRVLRTMGFVLAVQDDIFARQGYLAGSDRHRADHLMQLFDDPAIDGIVCARGGYGSMRLLPLLDTQRITAHPKVFVGFSDLTAILVFLACRCRMVCFHGPTVTTLGRNDPVTHEQFVRTLTQAGPFTVSATPAKVINPGRAVGTFLCGNLTLFCHLIGTSSSPDFTGTIVLLEDQGEAPYRIDRMLTQMRLAGCFEGLAGLALGTFKNCGKEEELHAIVADRMAGLGIPVVAGFAVGHADVNHTLPVGVPVELDGDSGSLTFNPLALR